MVIFGNSIVCSRLAAVRWIDVLVVPNVENLWCDICDLVEAPRVILGAAQRTPKGDGIGIIPMLAQAGVVSTMAAVLFDNECVWAFHPRFYTDRAFIVVPCEKIWQFGDGDGMNRG